MQYSIQKTIDGHEWQQNITIEKTGYDKEPTVEIESKGLGRAVVTISELREIAAFANEIAGKLEGDNVAG